MKEYKLLLKILMIMAPFFFMGCQNDSGQIEASQTEASVAETLSDFKSEPIPGQYIIVLKGESTVKKTQLKYSQMKSVLTNELVSKFSNAHLAKENIIQTYGYAVNGFAAKINKEQLEILKADSRVKLIEQDQLITLGKPANPGSGGGGTITPAQEKPWGIGRVNGGVIVNPDLTGTAWIIDTGIDLDHPDLNVDVSRSTSFLGGKDAFNPDDGNGHGTHVAGTIAAIDNSIGVIGVAAGAKVVAVRVLDSRGSGTYSGVMAGVDYVGREGKAGDVANMSLGGSFSQALNDAVIAASSKGVIFCVAAGNDGKDANNYSPASAEGGNIRTVSASDSGDNFAYFSNYGNPPIDWCAPGVSIKSTWKGGGYNTISGTSMATPHVAGVLLLGSGQSGGFVKNDKDASPDTIITH